MFTKLYFTAVVLAGLFSVPAFAATLDFNGAQGGGSYVEDGLQFDDIRIQNGNCDADSGAPCGALNKNEDSTLTKTGGSARAIAFGLRAC